MKIRKLSWSDHCFNFRFQLTLLDWEICNRFEIWFRISVLCNEGLRLSLSFYLRVVSISAAFYSFI